MSLLSVAEALVRVLDGALPLPSENAPLLGARGRVLASDLAARLTLPPFDASAMDGWAVRADDIANIPATLRIAGEAAAGRALKGSVGAGEAARILTGAPVPSGADTVVIQENAGRGTDDVVIKERAPRGANIRLAGGDFSKGDILLRSGVRLAPRHLALAAAMGHANAPVRRKPRVAVIATGDELVPPGTAPGPDQVVSSIPHGLAAMIEAAGGEAELLGIAPDTRAGLSAKLDEASGADIIVTTGGASVGDHDLVAPVLEERGLALAFWKIAMRPGKPLLFGRLGRQRVFGLPGNPVSALVCARLFLVPLVSRLLGLPDERGGSAAALVGDLPANGPRAHYMRAKLTRDDGGLRAEALDRQDSSLLSALAAANCLIVREPNAPSAKAGDRVEILDIDF